MKIELCFNGKNFRVQLDKPIDLSSTYGDSQKEPRAWYAPPVQIEAFRAEGWIGAVSEGSPVNFFDIKLNPHGNGTHTECVGHISLEKQSVDQHFRDYHGIVHLQRVKPRGQANGDQLVTLADWPSVELAGRKAVAVAVEGIEFPQDFSGANPAYFEPELLQYLADQGVEHFITNLPSVDREEDGGALAAHKAFWNYPDEPRLQATITELAYFPGELNNGDYFYNLQLAPIANDASPSRLLFYRLEEI
jgi:kynurenine formamidase